MLLFLPYFRKGTFAFIFLPLSFFSPIDSHASELEGVRENIFYSDDWNAKKNFDIGN